MPKPDNQWQQEALLMAERIDRQRDRGMQLALLPDEVGEPVAGEDQARQAGRPKGAKNKVSSQMREWLAARGMRMPEDVLVEIAGLNCRDDVITLAMAQTERILSWAFDGAHIGDKAAPKATSAMRLDVFRQQYTMILRAAEAILPFTAPKVTPDVNVQQNTTFILPSAPSAPAVPGADARDVTPPSRGRMRPADVVHEIEQNQCLGDAHTENSDAETRTGKLSNGKDGGKSDAATD
ncbi:hypothetical protein [Pseudooceanicola algae]|uniref:Uncharacterized protein n=1 Tax=Pseudooceanicola algae TaxID=1537215 RepID=A0A418SK72_9RHOB|nr:hypothetical protein [Pseudooceanicola algae]QPM89144.1 hypothetical protein PSAL_003550 [Pseudooceanicola algae]